MEIAIWAFSALVVVGVIISMLAGVATSGRAYRDRGTTAGGCSSELLQRGARSAEAAQAAGWPDRRGLLNDVERAFGGEPDTSRPFGRRLSAAWYAWDVGGGNTPDEERLIADALTACRAVPVGELGEEIVALVAAAQVETGEPYDMEDIPEIEGDAKK